MAGPRNPSHDSPKGDHEVVFPEDDYRIAAVEEQMLSGLQQHDQLETDHDASHYQGNVVDAPGNNDPQAHSETHLSPPSPALNQTESGYAPQMMHDLGNHGVNELKFDDDTRDSFAGYSRQSQATPVAEACFKASPGDVKKQDDSYVGNAAAQYNKLAAQNRQKIDPRLEGLDEIGRNEYREKMESQLAGGKGTDFGRNEKSFFGDEGGYTRKRGGSLSVRSRGRFPTRSSPMRFSPRRTRSTSPYSRRRSSFATAEASVFPKPREVSPDTAKKVALAREFSNAVRVPKTPRGKGKSSASRGNIARSVGASSRVYSLPRKMVSPPFTSASKGPSAEKAASDSGDEIRVKLPSATKSASGRLQVSTDFSKTWMQNAGPALAEKCYSGTAPFMARSTMQSPTSGLSGTAGLTLACELNSSSSDTGLNVQSGSALEVVPEEDEDDTDLIVQSTSVLDDVPEESYMGTHVVSLPSADRITEGTPREDPVVDDLVSLRGSSDDNSSLMGAERDLQEVNDDRFWRPESGQLPSDAASFKSSDKVDDGVEAAEAAITDNAADDDEVLGGKSAESSMLIDLSSPAREPASSYSFPENDLPSQNRYHNISAFVVSQSLMDNSFEMDADFELADYSAHSASGPNYVDVAAVVSDEAQQSTQSSSGVIGAPFASGTNVVGVTAVVSDETQQAPQISSRVVAAPFASGPNDINVAAIVSDETQQLMQTRSGAVASHPRITYQIGQMRQMRLATTAEMLTTIVRSIPGEVRRIYVPALAATRPAHFTATASARPDHFAAPAAPRSVYVPASAATRPPYVPSPMAARPVQVMTPRTPRRGVLTVAEAQESARRRREAQDAAAAAPAGAPVAATVSGPARRLASGEALGELVKTKKLGGLGDSKYASNAPDDKKSKQPLTKPFASPRPTQPPSTPTRPGRGFGGASFAQDNESERGTMGPPGRPNAANENISPFQRPSYAIPISRPDAIPFQVLVAQASAAGATRSPRVGVLSAESAPFVPSAVARPAPVSRPLAAAPTRRRDDGPVVLVASQAPVAEETLAAAEGVHERVVVGVDGLSENGVSENGASENGVGDNGVAAIDAGAIGVGAIVVGASGIGGSGVAEVGGSGVAEVGRMVGEGARERGRRSAAPNPLVAPVTLTPITPVRQRPRRGSVFVNTLGASGSPSFNPLRETLDRLRMPPPRLAQASPARAAMTPLSPNRSSWENSPASSTSGTPSRRRPRSHNVALDPNGVQISPRDEARPL